MALRRTLGVTYRSLGQFDASLLNLQRGRALADSLLPPVAPEAQELTLDLALTEMRRGNIDSTEALIRPQLDRIPQFSEMRVTVLGALADVAYTRGSWQEADSLQQVAEGRWPPRIATPDSLGLAFTLLDRSFPGRAAAADGSRAKLDRAGRGDLPRQLWRKGPAHGPTAQPQGRHRVLVRHLPGGLGRPGRGPGHRRRELSEGAPGARRRALAPGHGPLLVRGSRRRRRRVRGGARDPAASCWAPSTGTSPWPWRVWARSRRSAATSTPPRRI